MEEEKQEGEVRKKMEKLLGKEMMGDVWKEGRLEKKEGDFRKEGELWIEEGWLGEGLFGEICSEEGLLLGEELLKQE